MCRLSARPGRGEESFTICEMDDIDVVLGLTFLEAYNRVFKALSLSSLCGSHPSLDLSR